MNKCKQVGGGPNFGRGGGSQFWSFCEKQGVLLCSTIAADVLASLLLDLKKVNVESSIFIIEFENLTVSYFWLLICFRYFSFLQCLSKNVSYSGHNVAGIFHFSTV